MSEERRQILEMVADKKITADEAERLLSALGTQATSSKSETGSGGKTPPKYLRIVVDSNEDGEGPSKVNIRVPMQLLRAGVKLAGIIPGHARVQVNTALKEHGVDLDLSQLKPENLEEIIETLSDLQVDVDESKNKVRIFCE